METGFNNTKLIRQQTVTEQIVSEIRGLIASGQYKYNDKIPTEHELAEKFSVSRSSIREAMKTLNYLGIIESQTSRGTRISKKNRIAEEVAAWSVLLSYEDIREVFVLGTALDVQSAIIAIEYLRHDTTAYASVSKTMSGIFKSMSVASVQDNYDNFRKYFSDYFRELYSLTQNNVFIALNECIDGLINEKVCQAYYRTCVLLDTTMYLARTWESIQNLSVIDSVDAFQQYGAFAFDVFSHYDADTSRT